MSQPAKAPVQIIDTGFYVIRGQTILDILDSLKATIPCAFNPTVIAVENMLAQVQAINVTPVAQPDPQPQPEAVPQPKSAPVVPASPVALEIVEGGSPQ